jgi:hypothetical protein
MSRPVSSARWASSGIAAALDDEVGPSPRRGPAQRAPPDKHSGDRQRGETRHSGFAAGNFSDELQLRGVDGFLGFLRLRHLLRAVADEQRHPTEQDDRPCQPQQAVG